MRAPIAFLFALLTGAAAANDLPVQGIAFAQAEEAVWLCRHENPMNALSCAREQCAEQAVGQACVATAWCFPARWSGTMAVWLGELHTIRVLCGAPSEAALTNALDALCTGGEAPARCDVTKIIDPQGNERSVEDMHFGTLPPAEPAGRAGTSSNSPKPSPAEAGSSAPSGG